MQNFERKFTLLITTKCSTCIVVMHCRKIRNQSHFSSNHSIAPLVETTRNVWLLMWSKLPGVRVSVQTTMQTLQASRTWIGHHFLWLTSSNNNTWNSQFVGETLHEEVWCKLFTTMAMHDIPMFRKQFVNNSLWSFIHWSHSTLVVIINSNWAPV